MNHWSIDCLVQSLNDKKRSNRLDGLFISSCAFIIEDMSQKIYIHIPFVQMEMSHILGSFSVVDCNGTLYNSLHWIEFSWTELNSIESNDGKCTFGTSTLFASKWKHGVIKIYLFGHVIYHWEGLQFLWCWWRLVMILHGSNIFVFYSQRSFVPIRLFDSWYSHRWHKALCLLNLLGSCTVCISIPRHKLPNTSKYGMCL